MNDGRDAPAAGVTTLAAGGTTAIAYRAGHFAGKAAAKMAVKNAAVEAIKLGRFGGEYAGASVQSSARWIRYRIREL
ncbi:MAG TPA: hypothetical protein VE645_10875 [Pseudonocardiaceae bacterium]|nr:hypothetical protein [Pseudonocardiaceae bacterium]